MATKRVSVNRLREGMVIASEVYSKTGTILVSENTPVTKEMISLLTRHFVEEVIVTIDNDRRLTENRIGGVTAGRAPQYQEWKEKFQVAENAISQNLREIISGSKDVDTSSVLDTLNGVLENSGNDGDFFTMVLKMKSSAASLYTHVVNVALMAQLLARWMRCREDEIEIATLAGVFHDIGIMGLPQGKMTGFTYLKELETDDYEKHVITGYNQLKRQKIHPDVLQAVLTHHESLDGRGYPLQVTQENIRQASRIVAIADAFDTLTMTAEGEANLPAFAALKKMQDWEYHKFDTQLLMEFTSHIAESMIQRSVRLSDGSVGQIIMVNKYNILSPVVRIDEEFVDLAKRKNLTIEEVL